MRLDAISPWVMLALCIACAGGMMAVWIPRLPTRALGVRILIACVAPIPSMYAVTNLRSWSIQVPMAYYVIIVGAILLGSVGRGEEIVEIGRAYLKRKPEESEPTVSRAFGAQVLLSLAVLYLLAFFLFEDIY